MYEQDYVMRQIKDLVKAIAKIFFNVDVESSAMEVIRDMQAKEKAMELLRQCDDKNICYAEGELFDLIKNNTMDNLQVGITFYSYLNDMDDEQLAESDFSKTFKNTLWWVAAQFIMEVVVLMGWLPILGL